MLPTGAGVAGASRAAVGSARVWSAGAFGAADEHLNLPEVGERLTAEGGIQLRELGGLAESEAAVLPLTQPDMNAGQLVMVSQSPVMPVRFAFRNLSWHPPHSVRLPVPTNSPFCRMCVPDVRGDPPDLSVAARAVLDGSKWPSQGLS